MYCVTSKYHLNYTIRFAEHLRDDWKLHELLSFWADLLVITLIILHQSGLLFALSTTVAP